MVKPGATFAKAELKSHSLWSAYVVKLGRELHFQEEVIGESYRESFPPEEVVLAP